MIIAAAILLALATAGVALLAYAIPWRQLPARARRLWWLTLGHALIGIADLPDLSGRALPWLATPARLVMPGNGRHCDRLPMTPGAVADGTGPDLAALPPRQPEGAAHPHARPVLPAPVPPCGRGEHSTPSWQATGTHPYPPVTEPSHAIPDGPGYELVRPYVRVGSAAEWIWLQSLAAS